MLVLERSYIRPLGLFTSPNFFPSPLEHLAATEQTMSSAPKPVHRHSSSTDAVKNSVNLERSGETAEAAALADRDYYTRYPNNWAKIRSATRCQSHALDAYESNRELIREPAAEMLGTMILTLFGTAGNCQVVLSANTGVASSPQGDYLSLAIGWACGQSTLFFHRTSDQERRHRCWAWCLGLWRYFRRPRKPCSTLPFSAP
jgi:hypothetical protein